MQNGNTALKHAAGNGHSEIVSVLVKAHANVNLPNKVILIDTRRGRETGREGGKEEEREGYGPHKGGMEGGKEGGREGERWEKEKERRRE